MKTRVKLYLLALIALSTSCISDRQAKDGLVCMDFSKFCPEKEILLTDIADITYLYLNSDDEDYLYSGTIYSVSGNTVVVVDFSSGNILFFSNEGLPKSHFNRKGSGPEEYVYVSHLLYDEKTDDVFVVDRANQNGIKVYSSTGKFKRTVPLPKGTVVQNKIVSFDDYSLLFYDESIERERGLAIFENRAIDEYYKASFYLISKTDGEVLDYRTFQLIPNYLGIFIDGRRIPGLPGNSNRLIKSNDGVLLCNPENDTIYLYSKDKSVTPLINKLPIMGSTDPKTHINNCIDAGKYQFTEVITLRQGEPESGLAIFPVKHYIRDKSTGELFLQKLLLPDYQGEEFIISPSRRLNMIENGYWFELDLVELKQALKDNKLSGKLKELATTLNEDEDNNVFMIIHFK